ncbi:sugar phosphate isomerase/epimerase, partial [Flavobacteriaceae bacterium]|nr:sugar phosphate isomerase/epimerase [Flavobacteriaceae bacterium]
MKQNKFKSVGVLILIITTLFSVVACKNIPENKVETKTPFFKISLAQWSFHRTFRSGETSPYDFAKMAHELGFEGLEYVSQLYPDVTKSSDKPQAIQNFVTKNNMLSAEYKMQNVLIMI